MSQSNNKNKCDNDEIDGVNETNGGADGPPVDITGDHLAANDRTTAQSSRGIVRLVVSEFSMPINWDIADRSRQPTGCCRRDRPIE